MSYDVGLHDPTTGDLLDYGGQFTEGGTYALGGTTLCELNITYNYAEVFGSLVRDLDGKTAAETIGALRAFCEQWKNARPYDRDYWAPTPGNARKAVARLLTFAETHPQGVWRIS